MRFRRLHVSDETGVYTHPSLYQELNFLEAEVKAKGGENGDALWQLVESEYDYPKDSKKPTKVLTVIKARKELRKIDPEWAEKRTAKLTAERDTERSNETSDFEAKLAVELDKHHTIPDALAQEFGTEYTIRLEPVTAAGLSQATASTISGGEADIDLSPPDW